MDNFVLPTSPSSRDMNDQLLDPGCLGLHLFFIKILLYVERREESVEWISFFKLK